MKAILTDVTKCVGCEKCADACALEHGQRPNLLWRWSSKDGLSGERFTSIIRLNNKDYVRKQCRHCIDPACVSACPVGALSKDEDTGAVIYDSDRCMGCRYCMMACPYGIPRYSWQDNVPLVRKCTLCYENRLSKGKQPACTEACPEEATIFGEREKLIAEAKRRLKAEPDKYIQKVFGEHDIGGTQILYLSHVPLDFFGWKKDLGTNPVPKFTAPAMKAVIPAFFTVGIGMGIVYWITNRRSTVGQAKEQQNNKIEPENTDNNRSYEDET
ncbi:4Fe-4S dicluster domain-containing protein [candidate division KSB1 bacterium]